MNTILSSPFALIAFSAIPALVAIYLLRNRFRIHNVSSLMLWEDQRKARQGGLNLSRIQTPLLFFLELLAIIMLVLAAAGPMIRSNKEVRVFVIILDNSFSMLANNGTAPRDRAVKEIKRLLEESGDFQARFILAGKTPQLIGEPVKTISQAIDVLENWKCLAPMGDLNKSITLGSKLAGKTARILVITDHKPDVIPGQGRIEYWAFGKSLSNLAFVNASRASFEGKDRCFLSVANLSDEFIRTKLIVESLNNLQAIIQEPIELEPHQIYRTFFEPKTGPFPLRARLEDDSLDIDNEIVLVAEPPKTLSIRLDIENETLRSAVNKAIKAVKFTRLTSNEPHLLITDVPQLTPTGLNLWTVQILSEPNAVSYLGPFVVDHSHPLTEGLSLEGVIWGAAKTNKFTGLPVIAAGNIPLLTDKESPTGAHNITVNLNHDLSTLAQSANWPILLWNLIQWRKSFLPGLAQSNIMLGSTVTLTKDSREKDLFLIDPDNNTKDISTLTKTVLINPDVPGLYRVKTEKSHYALAVNAVSKSESDLTKANTGKWGRWQQASLYWWEYRPVDWVLLLIALALLTTHRFTTVIQQKGAGI
jgi:hypothetical protein